MLQEQLINLWLDGYRKIFCYTGRENSNTYGWFVLINTVLLILALILGAMISNILPFLGDIICFAIVIGYFLPILAYNVRRLHDGNYSGWLCLLYLVCGALIFIVASIFIKSTVGPNKYGEQPKNVIHFK